MAHGLAVCSIETIIETIPAVLSSALCSPVQWHMGSLSLLQHRGLLDRTTQGIGQHRREGFDAGIAIINTHLMTVPWSYRHIWVYSMVISPYMGILYDHSINTHLCHAGVTVTASTGQDCMGYWTGLWGRFLLQTLLLLHRGVIRQLLDRTGGKVSTMVSIRVMHICQSCMPPPMHALWAVVPLTRVAGGVTSRRYHQTNSARALKETNRFRQPIPRTQAHSHRCHAR